MINLKRIDAPQSTITYDKNKIDAQTGSMQKLSTNWKKNWRNSPLIMIV